jgi:hypothetical protein
MVAATVRAGIAFASGSTPKGAISLKAAVLADWFLGSTLAIKIMMAGFGLLLGATLIGLALSRSWIGSQPRNIEIDPIVAQLAEPPHRRPLDEDEHKEGDDARRVPGTNEDAAVVKSDPPRSPVRFLDLQPHANQKLKDRFAALDGNDLAELSLGEQVLAGVKFNIEEGLIHLRGRGMQYPERAVGIKVDGTFATLHVLHATQWDSDKADCLVGYYIVHYDGGQQAKIPMVFGKDLANWWTTCKGPGGAKIAWKGKNDAATKTQGANLQLYVSRWINPEPTRRVASIDFVSANSDVAPFCVAMTVED